MKIVLETLSNGAVLATVIDDGGKAVERGAFNAEAALAIWVEDRVWKNREVRKLAYPLSQEDVDSVSGVVVGSGFGGSMASTHADIKDAALEIAKNTRENVAEHGIGLTPPRAHVDSDKHGRPVTKPLHANLDAGVPSDVEAAE